MSHVNGRHKAPGMEFFIPMIWSWITDACKPIKKVDKESVLIKHDEIRVWRVGHATMLINLFGTTILTDPVLVNWIPIPRRIVEPGLSFKELPDLDYIIISHAHLDHFNIKTLKKLAHKTKTIIVPKNCSDLLKKINVKRKIELSWNSSFTENGVTFNAMRPEHWGQRVPWEKVVRYYNAFIVEKNGKGVYFGGDSGYGPFYKKIREIYSNVEIAIMGIGAYCPDQFRKSHKNPEEALQAFTEMGAHHMIPMHYGDFRLSLEPLEEPVERLLASGKEKNILSQIHVLANGKSWATK